VASALGLENASSRLDSCSVSISASLPNAAGAISGRWGYHSSPAYYVAALRTAWHWTARAPRVDDRAAEQRDAADEGRLEASGSTMVGTVIVNQGGVVRPSQLIASVRQTTEDGRRRDEYDQRMPADGPVADRVRR
jgi:hypothetical protein